MDCKEIFERISEYIDKDLDSSMCDEIEAHIQDCEPCIAFINTLRKTVDLFQGTAPAKEDIPQPVNNKLLKFLKENIEPN